MCLLIVIIFKILKNYGKCLYHITLLSINGVQFFNITYFFSLTITIENFADRGISKFFFVQDDKMDEDSVPDIRLDLDIRSQKRIQNTLLKDKIARRNLIRKNSISLLDPEATAIPSLLDLTQQDFEVNAPVGNFLLQGEELLTALEVNSPI